MESKPFIKLVQRAVVSALQQKPVLPTSIWDVPPEQRPSPPASPCTEVVVVTDGPRLPKAGSTTTARAATLPLESFVLQHPAFCV
jgi:hypothetical protein